MTPESDDPTVLDARGLRCPEPVMLLHRAFAELEDGQVLRVLATDPTTERDIPQFCRFLGHSLLQKERREATQGECADMHRHDVEYCYVLRKGA